MNAGEAHNGQCAHTPTRSCYVDGEQCGLSLDQLGHEDIGRQQEARSEAHQNMFVAGIIRRGLYKDGWQLVITGAPPPCLHCTALHVCFATSGS